VPKANFIGVMRLVTSIGMDESCEILDEAVCSSNIYWSDEASYIHRHG